MRGRSNLRDVAGSHPWSARSRMVVGMVEGLMGSSKEIKRNKIFVACHNHFTGWDSNKPLWMNICPTRYLQDPHPDRSWQALRQVAGDPGAERHLRRVEDPAAEGARSRRGVRDRAPGGRPPLLATAEFGELLGKSEWKLLVTLGFNGWFQWVVSMGGFNGFLTGFEWVLNGFLDHPLKETFSVQPSQKGP